MPLTSPGFRDDLADVLHGEINTVGERALIHVPRHKEFHTQDFAGMGAGAGHGVIRTDRLLAPCKRNA